jgi:hypothetical protein
MVAMTIREHIKKGKQDGAESVAGLEQTNQ